MSTGEEGGGGMSDHLKRYQTYVNSLKSGKSSGISAAFGRAADILPPEALEIKAPTFGKTAKSATVVSPPPLSGSKEVVVVVAEPLNIEAQVLDPGADRVLLRRAVEEMVTSCAAALDDPVGTRVMTDDGEQEVISVYLENGERMFLLSDLSMINEKEFSARLISEEEEIITQPRPVQTPPPAAPQVELQKSPVQAKPLPQPQSQTQPQPQIQFQIQLPATLPNHQTLEVKSQAGAQLWQIYFGESEVSLVSMADGGLIKRAEGRNEYVFSTLSQTDGDIKIYILSGLIVDPLTGNIYIEVNEGAYTAAFLNNGWRIHQYRRHDGSETFYVTEPVRPDRAPITTQVKALHLDMKTGEVSYETMDSSANITLKSRVLSP